MTWRKREIKALAQPEQEPVAWMNPSWIDPDTRGWESDSFESIPIEGWLPLYTHPPQRTWVGLTDEQFLEAARLAEAGNYLVAFQRIQQWIKDGNT